MRRQMALMSQALHFLDFGVSANSLARWRTTGLREPYNHAYPDLDYTAPLFLDSGGFKLLWTRELDLSRYGIRANSEAILHLQRDFGGEIIATLDYPLPPG
jgi:7-cyano-7-deazaguanine tRNA-ribosyltransferase